jgi:hypothetical protein
MLRHRVPDGFQIPSHPIPVQVVRPESPLPPRPATFEPLDVDAGLFGLQFRSFQAEMLR